MPRNYRPNPTPPRGRRHRAVPGSNSARQPGPPIPALASVVERRALRGGAIAAAAFAGVFLLAIVPARAVVDFAAGVLSLVSLTAAVLWGLSATDRLILDPKQRLLAQAIHRGAVVAGLGFLALHIWVKVTGTRTTVTAAVVPFTDPKQPGLVGLGTLAMYLFLVSTVTGALRSSFVSSGRVGWWRALHMFAYIAWGASLIHGLKAGRPAAGWVTAAYLLSVVGVGAALVLRAVSVPSDSQRRTSAQLPSPVQPLRPTRVRTPQATPGHTVRLNSKERVL
ncbi:hypothetical protein ABZ721_23850 [Streptomyces sp. NPDC006733]|uniref:hypothetical protein n=1 Tax=Streptomyces sp. NPDC006733 TaxID=3155460 RepID=UPI0033F02A89